MEGTLEFKIPQGDNPPSAKADASRSSDSGGPAKKCVGEESELPRTSTHIKTKRIFRIGTINIQTMTKTGKLKQILDEMRERNIGILAIQETRYRDEETVESEGFMVLKGKPGIRVGKGKRAHTCFGTGFIVNKRYEDGIMEVKSRSERISTLTFKTGNKKYTIINGHAPTNDKNRKDPKSVDNYWEEMDDTLSKIPKGHVKILVGDYNAQIGRESQHKGIVGEYPAHKRTNKNGERLIELCRENKMRLMTTHFRAKPNKKKTWASPNTKLGEFQIDHVAISQTNTKEIMNTKVRKNTRMESDHYLTEVKCRWIPNRARKPQTHTTTGNTKIDREKLRHNQDKYEEGIQIHTEWEHMKANMENQAKIWGKEEKTKRHWWWNKDCEEAVEKRRKCWRDWNSKKNPEKWEAFVGARKEAARTIRWTKRQRMKQELDEIENNFKKNNNRDFFGKFKKRLSGYKCRELFIRDKRGELAISARENSRIMAEYFQDLLNCEPPEDELELGPDQEEQQSRLPTREEVEQAIRDLKNNKATGDDGIAAEMMKWGGAKIIDTMNEVIKTIWRTKELPEGWKNAIIIPIHKKGDKKDANNYRGISLLEVGYKVLSRILLIRVEEQLGDTIGEYQAGFRKGRGCTEQIFNLKQLIEHRAIKNKKTTITFVDFKKAYDSIDRQTLVRILKNRGLDCVTRELITEILTDTKARVKFRGTLSEEFEIKTGVKQGDGLSPMLFNIVLDEVIRQWRTANEKMGIPKTHVGDKKDKRAQVDCLAFADDIAIVSETEEDARIQLENLSRISRRVGLRIAYDKTKTLNTTGDWVTPEGTVQKVDKFKYLGEFITGGVNGSREGIRDRVRKMKAAYLATKEVYNKKNISTDAKIRHYKATVRNAVLYASETMTLGRHGAEQLEKEERRILRKILGPKRGGVKWIRRSRDELYRNMRTISEEIRVKRARFAGHVVRMDMGRLSRRVWETTGRTRGKTGTKWVVELRKDWTEMGVKVDGNGIGVNKYTPTHMPEIIDRKGYRDRIEKHRWKRQERRTLNISDEERERRRERMKRFWEEKRKSQFITELPVVPQRP